MVGKITEALGETAESAPVVFAPPFPKAKVTVILGGRALRKWFPGRNAAPGQWVEGLFGEEALVSYSPEYILRFAEVTPAVDRIKRAMWQSLKAARQRLAARAAEDERA